jgi:hypothetical protein
VEFFIGQKAEQEWSAQFSDDQKISSEGRNGKLSVSIPLLIQGNMMKS